MEFIRSGASIEQLAEYIGSSLHDLPDYGLPSEYSLQSHASDMRPGSVSRSSTLESNQYRGTLLAEHESPINPPSPEPPPVVERSAVSIAVTGVNQPARLTPEQMSTGNAPSETTSEGFPGTTDMKTSHDIAADPPTHEPHPRSPKRLRTSIVDNTI